MARDWLEAKLQSIYVDWDCDEEGWLAPSQFVVAAFELLRTPKDAGELAELGLRAHKEITEITSSAY